MTNAVIVFEYRENNHTGPCYVLTLRDDNVYYGMISYIRYLKAKILASKKDISDEEVTNLSLVVSELVTKAMEVKIGSLS